jgi:hypothetical protein
MNVEPQGVFEHRFHSVGNVGLLLHSVTRAEESQPLEGPRVHAFRARGYICVALRGRVTEQSMIEDECVTQELALLTELALQLLQRRLEREDALPQELVLGRQVLQAHRVAVGAGDEALGRRWEEL